MSNSVFWDNKKNIINFLSAELAQGVVKAKVPFPAASVDYILNRAS